MTIIELLNKIAKGEEMPKKIKYNGIVYIIGEDEYFMENDLETPLFIDIIEKGIRYINDEVEIIDTPKKIEKIDLSYIDEDGDKMINIEYKKIQDKINEIIDKIEEMED